MTCELCGKYSETLIDIDTAIVCQDCADRAEANAQAAFDRYQEDEHWGINEGHELAGGLNE